MAPDRIRRFRTTLTMAGRIVDNDRVMDTKSGRVGIDAICEAAVPDDEREWTLTVKEIEDGVNIG